VTPRLPGRGHPIAECQAPARSHTHTQAIANAKCVGESVGFFCKAAWQLLDLCVLGLRLLQNGNVRGGVFPDGEEVLVSGAALDAVTR
jgi:hypothetical protein